MVVVGVGMWTGGGRSSGVWIGVVELGAGLAIFLLPRSSIYINLTVCSQYLISFLLCNGKTSYAYAFAEKERTIDCI